MNKQQHQNVAGQLDPSIILRWPTEEAQPVPVTEADEGLCGKCINKQEMFAHDPDGSLQVCCVASGKPAMVSVRTDRCPDFTDILPKFVHEYS